MSRFGNILKGLRTAHGLTMDQVARKIGSHKGYISGIENDQVNPPSVKLIKKIAKLYGQDVKRLVRIAWVDKAPRLIKDDADKFLEWCELLDSQPPTAIDSPRSKPGESANS